MPSPGEYDPKDERYTNINYTFGHQNRPNPMSRDALLNPGPAHY